MTRRQAMTGVGYIYEERREHPVMECTPAVASDRLARLEHVTIMESPPGYSIIE